MDILNQIPHLKRLNLKEQSKLMQLLGYLKEKTLNLPFLYIDVPVNMHCDIESTAASDHTGIQIL